MTRHRCGLTVLEIVAAGVILAAVTTICLQLLAASSVRRRATENRQVAIHAAANVMERVMARPFDELPVGTVDDCELPDLLRNRLPAAELTIEVDEASEADGPVARQITVLLCWNDRRGQPVRPVRLVAWRHRGGGQP